MSGSIGIVGLGRMGMPICANLVRGGFAVIASDRKAALEADAIALGANWASSSAQTAAAADVLITMLPGPPEVREAMLGPSGALPALPAGATWIDMSSSSPAVGREVSEHAHQLGIHCLDAPVGGGPRQAAAAALQLFVGGDAEIVERHEALLATLGEPLHVGPPGAGYITKLLVNLLWFGQAIATAEALLLGRRAGIDLGVLRGALATSAAGGGFIRDEVDALFAGDYLTSFGLDRCCEELESITALAHELEAPFELSALVNRIHHRALERYGPVNGELLAVALLEEQAGIDLRHPPRT